MKKIKHMKELFEKIKWPEEFIVEFNDNEELVFTSSQGVLWDDGNNLDGNDENRANISCCLKKKSQSQQRHRLVEIFVDEIKSIKTPSGEILWSP